MKRLLPFIFLLLIQFTGNKAKAQPLHDFTVSAPVLQTLHIQQLLFDAIRIPNATFFFQTDTGTGGGEIERIREEREPKSYTWWTIWFVLGLGACMVIYFLIKRNPRKDVE